MAASSKLFNATRSIGMAAIALFSITLTWAQSYGEPGYRYLYDYDHRVVVRECVSCTDDMQDLWNGDYVRLINGQVYIYRGNTRIVYGDKVWLEHTGDYTAKRGSYMYLYDSDGDRWGVSGETINLFWNKICEVERGDYWYLYTRSGNRLGNVYSTMRYSIFWNGYYSYRTNDGYYRIADEDGNYVNNSYSDDEPDLTASGNFRIYRSGSSILIDRRGNRVY